MRHLLFFLLFLPVADAWAKDFRCIVPGEDRFYMDGGRMLGLRVIASETVDGGTVHHFHHDLRPVGFNDPSGCNPDTSCGERFRFTRTGASWMGDHMVEYENGLNLFFNLLGDTIRIYSTAALGESWVVCNVSDTLFVHGTVSSIAEEQVMGSTQLVKSISFTVIDSVGVP